MSKFNEIVKSVITGSGVQGGRLRSIGVATQTTSWERSTDYAMEKGAAFKKALEAHQGKLPSGTESVVARELAHTSESDWSSHYTAVAFDKDGKYISSLHVHAIDESEGKAEKKTDKQKKDKSGKQEKGSK